MLRLVACNLYSMRRARTVVAHPANAMSGRNHSALMLPGVFPDYAAPGVLKNDHGARDVRDSVVACPPQDERYRKP